MSADAKWEETYRDRWPLLAAKLQETKGIVLGFHSVVDGLQRAESDWLPALLDDAALTAEVERSLGDVPLMLVTPKDFVVAMIESMRTGKAMQRMISQEGLFKWVLDTIGYERLRMGGTSGNMANSLAPLGLPLLVYANPLSRELCDLFAPQPNLTVMVEEGDRHRFVPPAQVEAPAGVKALHLIIEYPKGLRVKFGRTEFETPRANRFIAGWNPTNSQLRINPSFKRGLLEQAGDFGHIILSGFHILAETYPDGSTYRECLLPVADFCREARVANPSLRMHYEFASIASPLIRKGTLDWVLPAVDSLGLNEVEMAALLEEAGEPELAARARTDESPVLFLQGARALLEKACLKRVHFHNLGYYLVLSKADYSDPTATRDSLIYAAVLAAARTASGRTGPLEEMTAGLNEPIAQAGLDALGELSSYLKDPDFPETGIGRLDGYQVVCVPTKLVAKPVLTVGLGDLISSTAFVFDRRG